MVPERFLEGSFSSVTGEGFEQGGKLNHEVLKPFTEEKALKSSTWSVLLLLHADFADAKRVKMINKLKRNLKFILWDSLEKFHPL